MSEKYKRADFQKAIGNLTIIMDEPESAIVRDAAIKRYELCYELAWKSIQEALREEGLEICKSPKSCFKQAFKQGWILDEEGFSEMFKMRDLTTHTYKEDLAREIYINLNKYLALFELLSEELQIP